MVIDPQSWRTPDALVQSVQLENGPNLSADVGQLVSLCQPSCASLPLFPNYQMGEVLGD